MQRCWARTSATSVSPRPRPSRLVLKNGVNRRSRASGAIPGPLSRTASRVFAVLAPQVDGDAAVLADGLHGVLQDVDQHLLDLVLVHLDVGHRLLALPAAGDAARLHLRLQQRQDVLHQRRQRHRPEVGERETHDLGEALR